MLAQVEGVGQAGRGGLEFAAAEPASHATPKMVKWSCFIAKSRT